MSDSHSGVGFMDVTVKLYNTDVSHEFWCIFYVWLCIYYLYML